MTVRKTEGKDSTEKKKTRLYATDSGKTLQKNSIGTKIYTKSKSIEKKRLYRKVYRK